MILQTIKQVRYEDIHKVIAYISLFNRSNQILHIVTNSIILSKTLQNIIINNFKLKFPKVIID